MGAVNNTLVEFVEAVFPDSFEDQDLLQEIIMGCDPNSPTDAPPTIEEYRRVVLGIGLTALRENPSLLPRTTLREIVTLLQGHNNNADISH